MEHFDNLLNKYLNKYRGWIYKSENLDERIFNFAKTFNNNLGVDFVYNELLNMIENKNKLINTKIKFDKLLEEIGKEYKFMFLYLLNNPDKPKSELVNNLKINIRTFYRKLEYLGNKINERWLNEIRESKNEGNLCL